MTRWQVIEKLIKDNNFKVIAEIGVSVGATAKYLIENCELETYYLIDPRRCIELDSWLEAITYVNWNYISKPSSDAIPMIKDGSLDLAFIDGAHDEDSVRSDCQLIQPKMRPNGIICGHDYARRSVKAAVDTVFGYENLQFGGKRSMMWWIRV